MRRPLPNGRDRHAANGAQRGYGREHRLLGFHK